MCCCSLSEFYWQVFVVKPVFASLFLRHGLTGNHACALASCKQAQAHNASGHVRMALQGPAEW